LEYIYFFLIFATEIRKETRHNLLYSLTSPPRERANTYYWSCPKWAQISPVYRYGLWWTV